MGFILSLLREIPGLERIHVVEFPSEPTMELLSRGRPSSNRAMFERLRDQGVIDSYYSLNAELHAEGRRISTLTCPRESHFCELGNR